MQEFIFRVNIERFQQLAAQETDPIKRDRLERMLVDEQEKLQAYRARLESAPSPNRTGDGPDPQPS